MPKRTAKQNAPSKRISTKGYVVLKEEYIPLLNADLAAWKAKLSNLDDTTGWNLYFFSQDANHLAQDKALFSYGSNPSDPKPWLFEEYLCTFQNRGRFYVASSRNASDLMPASSLAAKRLQLFGFYYVIAPSEIHLEGPSIRKVMNQCPGYVYGVEEKMVSNLREERLPSLGFENPSLQDPAYIDKLYEHVQNARRPVSVEALLQFLEKEVVRLRSEVYKTNFRHILQ